MTIATNQVWANGIAPAATTLGKIASGFECGDSDPDLFNYILKLYGQCLIDLQNDKADTTALAAETQARIDADSLLVDADSALGLMIGQNGQAITSLSVTVQENVQAIAQLAGEGLPDASTTAKGVVQLSTFATTVARTNTTLAITPRQMHAYEASFGSLARLYELPGGASFPIVWFQAIGGGLTNDENYNSPDVLNMKGAWAIRIQEGPTRYAVNFNVWWDSTNDPEVYIDEKVFRSLDLIVAVTATVATTLLNIKLLTLAGAPHPTFTIQNLKRLNMSGVLSG